MKPVCQFFLLTTYEFMNRKRLKKNLLFAFLVVSLLFIIPAVLIVADGLTDEIYQRGLL